MTNKPGNSAGQNDESLLRPPGERVKKDPTNDSLDESPFANTPDDPLEVLDEVPPESQRYSNEDPNPQETDESEADRHRKFANENGFGAMQESASTDESGIPVAPSSRGYSATGEMPREEIRARDNTRAIEIHYETEGRFNTPAIGYVEDFNVEGLNSLASATEDNLIETLVAIINKQLYDGVRAEEMLQEEFMETLYAIKQKDPNIKVHKHYWIHRCPNREQGQEPELSTTEIPIRGEGSLNTRSIKQAEEELRKIAKQSFDLMSADEFQLYLQGKYGKDVIITKEEEVKRISIREPFKVRDGDTIFTFRFSRMKDSIKAQREGNQRFSGKIRAIKSRQIHGANASTLKQIKEDELKKVLSEKQQFVAIYAKAQTLLTKDGKPLSDEQKHTEYKKLSREALQELAKYLQVVSFGLVDERTLLCEHCGNTERRSLHRDFHPIEFIPVEERNSKLDPRSKLGVHSKVGVYFGG